MQRWIPVLAVVLGLQLALAVALGLSADRLTAQKPGTPLVQAKLDAADQLSIEGPTGDEEPTDGAAESTGSVTLKKQNGTWVLPSYYDAPADASKVQGVLDKLADIKRGYAVATTAGALKRFEVAEDTFERRVVVSENAQSLATIYLGSSPGLRKTHARTAADEAVYAVDLTAYELPSQASDWLDSDLLKIKPEALAAIAITRTGQGSVRLVHHDPGADDETTRTWSAEGLPEGERLGAQQAQTLARSISELRVDGVLGTEAKPEWRQDQPMLTLGLEQRDGETVVWTLSKPEEGDLHVLKASNRPWYFALEEWNAKPLLEAAARDKLVIADQPEEAKNPKAKEAHAAPGTELPNAAAAPAVPQSAE